MRKNTIVEIFAGLLIFLFVYTALSKLSDVAGFQAAIKQSPLIGDRSVSLSWAVPLTEILIAVLLFIPYTRYWGFWASFIIMVIFTAYIGYMIAFTPHLPCSCGGVLRQMSWTQHLFFNIAFTLISLAGILLLKKSNSNNSGSSYHLA